jgi:uncharacterized protein
MGLLQDVYFCSALGKLQASTRSLPDVNEERRQNLTQKWTKRGILQQPHNLRLFFIALLCYVVRLYQLLISPLIGMNCRFYPTCSKYSIEAIRLHGPFKGVYMSLKRVLRCHPFGAWGYDPVSSGDDCLDKMD